MDLGSLLNPLPRTGLWFLLNPSRLGCLKSFCRCLVAWLWARGEVNRDYEGVYNASDAANTKLSGKAPKVSTHVMAFLKRGVPGPKKSFRPAKRRRVKSLQWLMNYQETHKHASGGALGLHTLVQPEDHGKRKSSFFVAKRQCLHRPGAA